MKEKIRLIKYFRMKPEERFLVDILNEMVEVKLDKYPDSIFYKYNNEIIFEYNLKDNYFYVRHDRLWSNFQSNLEFKYQELNDLIKNMVEQYINLKNIIPKSSFIMIGNKNW